VLRSCPAPISITSPRPSWARIPQQAASVVEPRSAENVVDFYNKRGMRLIRPVMHHVRFKTTRLQEMIDWYATTVGTKVNFRFSRGVFISNDRANHRIALLALPGLQEDPQRLTRTGLHHTAFEYGSFDDLMRRVHLPSWCSSLLFELPTWQA
jgi:hypothetical protein